MGTKIYAPNPNFEGESRYGDVLLTFKDGEAVYEGHVDPQTGETVKDLPDAVRSYMQGHGYGIGGRSKAQDVRYGETIVPADPREVGSEGDGVERLGAPLRDAAVDPRPEDFLPPINAGKEGEAGNPHGPHVVSPEIHAAGDQAVVPGPVGRFEEDPETGANVVVPDVEEQEARESQYAERALIGHEKVPDVLVSLGEQAGQPEPAEQLREAAEWTAEQNAQRADGGAPKGNAGLPEWQEYARSQGASEDELSEATRNDLRDKYGPK